MKHGAPRQLADQKMLHLIEPTHSERFVALLEQHYPTWREARAELNELPLVAEAWETPGMRRSNSAQNVPG